MQCRAMIRHNHHHHPATTELQLFNEAIEVVDQPLGTRFVITPGGAAIGGQRTVAVMQRRGVIEQCHAIAFYFFAVLPPGIQYLGIAYDRRTVEAH
ncbi:hypothetical protein D3C84_870170 [compost metagenome]